MQTDDTAEASGDAAPAGDPWAALERALTAVVGTTLGPARQRELCGEFMAMGQRHDAERGQPVWGYKHVGTRRYVFLDAADRAFTYDARGGRYVPTAVRDGLARARGAV